MESQLRIARRPTLDRPILIAAFRGWNDGGQGASLAVGYLAKLWDAEIRTINPEARFVPNGLPTLHGAAELADILFLDRQGRSGVNPPWVNGLHAKKHRAVLGRKPIGGIFSVGLEEAPRWKDSVQSPAEIRVWVAEGIANGLRPWFVKFGGVLYDRR